MKKSTLLFFALFFASTIFGQTADEKAVEQAMLNYIEGFYEGDTTKLIQCLHPKLSKYGYWKEESGEYHGSAMSFEGAKKYAKGVKEKGKFPSDDAPKKVELYEVQDKTACGKITAWWGTDYVLLAKLEGDWKITHVTWQGPN